MSMLLIINVHYRESLHHRLHQRPLPVNYQFTFLLSTCQPLCHEHLYLNGIQCNSCYLLASPEWVAECHLGPVRNSRGVLDPADVGVLQVLDPRLNRPCEHSDTAPPQG